MLTSAVSCPSPMILEIKRSPAKTPEATFITIANTAAAASAAYSLDSLCASDSACTSDSVCTSDPACNSSAACICIAGFAPGQAQSFAPAPAADAPAPDSSHIVPFPPPKLTESQIACQQKMAIALSKCSGTG